MLFLLLALIWVLVCSHVVAGAILFRRLFPRESPWFGFIFPGLALVLVLNFVEHAVAFPSLRWLGGLTFLGSIWLIFSRTTRWRFLRLPTIVFLGAFTFTLFLRGLKPDIAPVRDGILDLHLVSAFCMGQTLPPDAPWLPGFKLQYYYTLPHYAASVLIRLFGFDIGTGFNVASALVGALASFLIAAIAWRVGGHRVWIVALAMVLTASAMNGSTPYLWLTHPENKNPDDTVNLLSGSCSPGPFPMDAILRRQVNIWNSHELLPPGYYTWIGGFHSVMAGQFIVLLGIYSLVEMVRRRPTCGAWLGALASPLLMLVSSTWGLPLSAVILLGGLIVCFQRKIAPPSWRTVALGLAAVTIALTPMLLDFLRTGTPAIEANQSDGRTQLAEFLIQWWPVFVPGVLLLFFWKRVNPVVPILQLALPLVFLLVEYGTLADRIDTTGKLWSYIFIAGWAVFLPAMAGLHSYLARAVTALFLVAGAFSLCFWIDYEHRSISRDDEWHLDGWGDLRAASDKGRIFNIVSTMDHRILLTGKTIFFAYNESPMMASLTRNSVYVAYGFHCDGAFYPNTYGEAARRSAEVNALYDGKNPDPLSFLRDRNVAAMVIWPDDNINNVTLGRLKDGLSADYVYEDCRDTNGPADEPNAGVFRQRAAPHPPPGR